MFGTELGAFYLHIIDKETGNALIDLPPKMKKILKFQLDLIFCI